MTRLFIKVSPSAHTVPSSDGNPRHSGPSPGTRLASLSLDGRWQREELPHFQDSPIRARKICGALMILNE